MCLMSHVLNDPCVGCSTQEAPEGSGNISHLPGGAGRPGVPARYGQDPSGHQGGQHTAD